MKSNKVVTTTLRLPKWLDEKLKEESKYKAISKNALILEKLRVAEKRTMWGDK